MQLFDDIASSRKFSHDITSSHKLSSRAPLQLSPAASPARLCTRSKGETRGGPKEGGLNIGQDERVQTCNELRVKHDQVSFYLRHPFPGTPLLPSGDVASVQETVRMLKDGAIRSADTGGIIIYVCVCICMCVSMYVCMCVYIHIYNIHMYNHMYVCIHIYIYIYLYLSLYIYTCYTCIMYIYIYICMHIYIYIYIYVYVYTAYGRATRRKSAPASVVYLRGLHERGELHPAAGDLTNKSSRARIGVA